MEGDTSAKQTIKSSKISIHALRVEGDYNADRMGLTTDISIHALRVEGDSLCEACHNKMHPISIHALRVEGDSQISLLNCGATNVFLSTPSGWRATARSRSGAVCVSISIHALRVEGDLSVSIL